MRPQVGNKHGRRGFRCARAAVASAAIATLGLTVTHASAGTRRGDVDDTSFTALANQPVYAGVGSVVSTISAGQYAGSGELLSSRWVLTAGHMVDVRNGGTDYTPSLIEFNIGGIDWSNGTTYTTGEAFTYPGFSNNSLSAGLDLALVHLTAPVSGITPVTRYTNTAESTATATIVGYGLSGTGGTGETIGYGTKRAGNNVIDQVGFTTPYNNSNLLGVDFDQPGNTAKSTMGANTPTALEYLPATGDSGGGLFIDEGGVQKLAGVVSFGNAPLDGTFDANYGDTAYFVRVSNFNAWIDDQMTAKFWNNSAGGAFATDTNWDDGLPGPAPNASNIVVFNVPGAYTVNSSGAVAVKRIRVRQGSVTMNLGGGTETLGPWNSLDSSITVAKGSGDNCSLTISNGTVSAIDINVAEKSGTTGQFTIASGGTITATNLLSIGGTSTLAGGTGSINVNSGGALQFSGGAKIWGWGKLCNGGSVTWSGGNITVSSGGSIINSANAFLDLQGNLNIFGNSSGNLTNAGTIRKTNGIATASVATTFTNTGTVQINSGSMSFVGGSSTGGTIVTAASTRFDFSGQSSFTFAGANLITGSGAVGFGSMVFNTGTLKIDTTSTIVANAALNNTGTVDLNNRLVIDYTTSAPSSTIRSALLTGYASGAWNGPGIQSSSAATIAGTPANIHKTGIGYIDNTQFNLTTFGPVNVDTTSLLMRYTLFGDTNLDLTVNSSDFNMLATNFNKTGQFWSAGDFNYDGTVNALDFNLLALNYGYTLPADLPSSFALGALVPEPATIGLLVALLPLRRTRR